MLCTKCSENNPEASQYCRKCGSPLYDKKQAATAPESLNNTIARIWHGIKNAPATGIPEKDRKTVSGLPLNISIALCYLWLWLSGIIMLVVEKRNKTICFHAFQSTITFGVITVILGLLTLLPPVPYGILYFLLMAVWVILIALGAYLWLLLLIRSFMGRPYTLPLIGKAASQIAGWYRERLGIQIGTPAKAKDEDMPQSKPCTVCGRTIPGYAVFCPACGEKQVKEVMEQMGQLGRTIESERAGDINLRINTAIRRALDATVNAVTVIGEKRDPYTAGHQRRVTLLALAIAHDMGLPIEQIEGLNVAGQMHDIGKISVPSDLLNKPGKLSEGEISVIRGHAQASYDILKDIEFPWPVAQIAYQHHERLDGSGYPRGLAGNSILLEARILCVADVVEAMASHRPYRPALGIDKALDEITRNSGKLYDPAVVESCVRLFREKGFSLD